MSLSELIDSLRRTERLYAELHDLSLAKRDQIVHSRLTEMTQTLAKESKLIKQLDEAEKARVQAVLAIQQEIGVAPDPHMPLRELTSYVTKVADKETLRQLSERLNGQAAALKQVNETNQLLIKQSLDFVNQSLDLLVGSPEDEAVYHAPTSPLPQQKRKGIFDTRA